MASNKIREDLVGVVWVDVTGKPLKLVAGQEIPKGVTVGDHLLAVADASSKDDDDTLPDGDPTGKWTIPQLTKFAEEKSIKLGDAKKKPEILAVIDAALKSGATELPTGNPDESWTLDQLTLFASNHSIDLGDADTEDDILAAITLAVEDGATEGDQAS